MRLVHSRDTIYDCFTSMFNRMGIASCLCTVLCTVTRSKADQPARPDYIADTCPPYLVITVHEIEPG